MAALPVSDMPAMFPPAGHVTNFDHPEGSLKPFMIGTATGFLTLSTIFMAMRITSSILAKRWYAEDSASVIAYAILVAWLAVALAEPFSSQVARHIWDVRFIDLDNILYNFNVLLIVYCPASYMGKLAVMLQLRRLFAVDKKGVFAYCINISIILITLFYVVIIFVAVFRCSPRDAAWKVLKPGKCINQIQLMLVIGIVNAASDYVTLILPVCAVMRLNLSRKRKLGALAVFSVGIITCAFGTIGTVLRFSLFGDLDWTYSFTKIGTFCVAELALLFCVGCTPSLPRFYQFIRGKTDKLQPTEQTPPRNKVEEIRKDRNRAEQDRDIEGKDLSNSMAKYMPGSESIFIDDTECSRAGFSRNIESQIGRAI